MEYLRPVDFAALDAAAGRLSLPILEKGDGATNCSVSCVSTPPGAGSPAGLHVHEVDQLFYILRGVMSVEVSGATHRAGPGTLVVFPAGVPHRNWNEGEEATIHLSILAPVPNPDLPFAIPVNEPS